MESVKNISNSEWQPAIQKASIAGTVLSSLGLMGIIWAKRRGSKLPKTVLPITATTGLLSIGGILVSRTTGNPSIDDPSAFAIEKLIGKSIKEQPIQEICKKIDDTSIEEEEKIELVGNFVCPKLRIVFNMTPTPQIVEITSDLLYRNEEKVPQILYLALLRKISRFRINLKDPFEIHLNCSGKLIIWENATLKI